MQTTDRHCIDEVETQSPPVASRQPGAVCFSSDAAAEPETQKQKHTIGLGCQASRMVVLALLIQFPGLLL